MEHFDFEAPADVFVGAGRRNGRHPMVYLRFETGAEAVRHIIEVVEAGALQGAVIETDEVRQRLMRINWCEARTHCIGCASRSGNNRSLQQGRTMMERTTTTTAVFQHPFMLGSSEGPFPAGTYVIETEEELIPGLSFQAYRRIRTTMNVPIERGVHTALQALTIDPKELEKALKLDAATATTTK